MNELGRLIETCSSEEKASLQALLESCQHEFNDLRTQHEDIGFFTDNLAGSRLDYMLDLYVNNISGYLESGYSKVKGFFHSVASTLHLDSAAAVCFICFVNALVGEECCRVYG